MAPITIITAFTGISFIAYGINSFISKRMIREFKRWGLADKRKAIGVCQCIGGFGLLLGFEFNIAIPISAVVIKTDTTARKPGAPAPKLDLNAERFECVFVMNENTASLRVIKTGIQDDSRIEITSGLALGDQVITGPYNTVTKLLDPGDRVALDTQEKESEEE